MKAVQRRWLTVLMLGAGVSLGSWLSHPEGAPRPTSAARARLDVQRAALGRVVLRNGSSATIRGRVIGPPDVTRPFFVPPHEVHEITLLAGPVTIEIDVDPAPVVRSFTLARGEVATVEYNGGP
jgi:hypothetical protein